MIRRVIPGRACGTVAAPPSKSAAHRLLIAAALAQGESLVTGVSPSRDVEATIACLSALGASVHLENGVARVRGVDPAAGVKERVLPCSESGSTLRFLLPLCLLSGEEITLTGTERLFARGLSVYEDLCRERGFLFRQSADRVTVRGTLRSGNFYLRGDLSSQFITGLLFTLPLLSGDSTVTLTTPLQSGPYIDLTLAALRQYGITVQRPDDKSFFIPGDQRYIPQNTAVEGDWSNAAFLLALNDVGGDVTVTGLAEDSVQGDRVCRAYLEAIRQGTPVLDVSDCPDLAPILMTAAVLHHGAALTGTERLRIKESDRGAAMAEEIAKCGGEVAVKDDIILISPGKLHPPADPLCGHNDHRVVMALTVLLSLLGGEITDSEAVGKSWREFFDVMAQIGVKTVETDQG